LATSAVFLAGFEKQAAFQTWFKIQPVSPLQCGCFLALKIECG
jgi:hypothetical protein